MRRMSMPVLAFFLLAATVGQFSAGAQTTPIVADPLNTPLIGAAPATPSATFAAPAPTAGISNAGRAGISNSAPLPTTLPSLSNTVVYVTQPPVETVTTGVPASVENTANPVAGASSGAASENNESGGRTMNDLGPSYYADALPSAGNSSLGELSAQYKARKATVNARLLTNDDVQQMVASKNGVTMAKNMPPLGQGPLEQSGQAQNAGTQNAQSTQQSPQTNPSANAANSQGGTPPPTPSAKDQSAGTGVNAENSTTPQINQTPQSNDAQGSRRLPATATILPLLGLLGLVSGGIGFWFRKFRK